MFVTIHVVKPLRKVRNNIYTSKPTERNIKLCVFPFNLHTCIKKLIYVTPVHILLTHFYLFYFAYKYNTFSYLLTVSVDLYLVGCFRIEQYKFVNVLHECFDKKMNKI